MTDYKLVPVEPTAEMLYEGLEVYASEDCAEADALGIYKAMLAAAPAVQQPHVAESVWMYKGSDGEWKPFMGEQHRLNTIADGGWGVREFFAAPIVQGEPEQPPLQLPDFATDPDDSDEVASLWDHGFKRGWNSCLGAVAKAIQPAEQQPDATQLVEALEQCITSMLDSGYRANAVVIRAARAALAPYRKG